MSEGLKARLKEHREWIGSLILSCVVHLFIVASASFILNVDSHPVDRPWVFEVVAVRLDEPDARAPAPEASGHEQSSIQPVDEVRPPNSPTVQVRSVFVPQPSGPEPLPRQVVPVPPRTTAINQPPPSLELHVIAPPTHRPVPATTPPAPFDPEPVSSSNPSPSPTPSPNPFAPSAVTGTAQALMPQPVPADSQRESPQSSVPEESQAPSQIAEPVAEPDDDPYVADPSIEKKVDRAQTLDELPTERLDQAPQAPAEREVEPPAETVPVELEQPPPEPLAPAAPPVAPRDAQIEEASDPGVVAPPEQPEHRVQLEDPDDSASEAQSVLSTAPEEPEEIRERSQGAVPHSLPTTVVPSAPSGVQQPPHAKRPEQRASAMVETEDSQRDHPPRNEAVPQGESLEPSLSKPQEPTARPVELPPVESPSVQGEIGQAVETFNVDVETHPSFEDSTEEGATEKEAIEEDAIEEDAIEEDAIEEDAIEEDVTADDPTDAHKGVDDHMVAEEFQERLHEQTAQREMDGWSETFFPPISVGVDRFGISGEDEEPAAGDGLMIKELEVDEPNMQIPAMKELEMEVTEELEEPEKQKEEASVPEEPVRVAPRPVLRVAPTYPPRAQRRGIEGSVTIELDIDVTGNPTGSRILLSSGRLDLDEAARRAAMQWRFSPARLGEEPIPDTVDVVVEFRLTRE